jgi:hypothetical protein
VEVVLSLPQAPSTASEKNRLMRRGEIFMPTH